MNDDTHCPACGEEITSLADRAARYCDTCGRWLDIWEHQVVGQARRAEALRCQHLGTDWPKVGWNDAPASERSAWMLLALERCANSGIPDEPPIEA